MVLDLRLPPRTSADEVTRLVATAWYVFVSCSVAAISKMIAHDPLTDPPDPFGTKAVKKDCGGSHSNLSREYRVKAAWQM